MGLAGAGVTEEHDWFPGVHVVPAGQLTDWPVPICVRTGQVVGATNKLGEFVTDNPVSPQDLAATIYHALGVPLNRWYRTQDGRPIELVPEGRPVRQLLG